MIVIVLAWLLGWMFFFQLRIFRPSELGNSALPTATVVIPARNEERNLAVLLSRLADDGQISNVIVVNDSSTDATAQIAREKGARVIDVSPPPGWTGKTWACWQGALKAEGDVLVFLDADTLPAWGFIESLVQATVEHSGLVSVQPFHRIEAFYERGSAFVQLVSSIGAMSRRSPMAFGPAIAISRSTYMQLDGHKAVRDEIAEDVALARKVRSHGLSVRNWLGGRCISYRMYPDGVRQLFEGWTKNLASGAGAVGLVRFLAIFVWIAVAARVGLLAIMQPNAYHVALYVAFALQIGILQRKVGRFGWVTAGMYPFTIVTFFVLFVDSLWMRYVRKSVRWRGRTIPEQQRQS